MDVSQMNQDWVNERIEAINKEGTHMAYVDDGYVCLIPCDECDHGVIEDEEADMFWPDGGRAIKIPCPYCDGEGMTRNDSLDCNCSECKKAYFCVRYDNDQKVARSTDFAEAVAHAMSYSSSNNVAVDVIRGFDRDCVLFETDCGLSFKFIQKQAA